MTSAKEVNGDSHRYTFEEILSGKAVFAEDEDETDPADEWVKTSYIYDVTAPYYEVISEKTKDAVTSYDYGIERISANFKNGLYDYKTAYVYDGRGSVALEATYNAAWAVLGSWLMSVTTLGKSYSPFGEMLEYKISGYGFNGEQYDAATGMINLRARQYEPGMMRFAQKDKAKLD